MDLVLAGPRLVLLILASSTVREGDQILYRWLPGNLIRELTLRS